MDMFAIDFFGIYLFVLSQKCKFLYDLTDSCTMSPYVILYVLYW
jgi:hypothetical protein